MRKVLMLLFMTLILLPPVSAQLFFDDQVRLFPFVADGKWGFIDKAGKTAIPPVYKSVSAYVDGYAVVELENGKMSLINAKGEHTFEPVDYKIFQPSEGLARVFKDGLWGYIDVGGTLIIPFKYEDANDFFKGIARVKIDRKFTFIDRKGDTLTKLYKLAYNFSEGLAIVEIDGKRGFIDVFDEIVIEPVYDDSDGFSQGLAAVRIKGKYGFVDRSGSLAIKAVYDNARWFSDGYAPVEIQGKWGFIDRDGDFRIEPTYIAVGNFYDGMAAVAVDGRWGYIDKKGKMVIEPKFSRAGNFNLGLASVETCSRNLEEEEDVETCTLAYVTREGELVWNSSP